MAAPGERSDWRRRLNRLITATGSDKIRMLVMMRGPSAGGNRECRWLTHKKAPHQRGMQEKVLARSKISFA